MVFNVPLTLFVKFCKKIMILPKVTVQNVRLSNYRVKKE